MGTNTRKPTTTSPELAMRLARHARQGLNKVSSNDCMTSIEDRMAEFRKHAIAVTNLLGQAGSCLHQGTKPDPEVVGELLGSLYEVLHSTKKLFGDPLRARAERLDQNHVDRVVENFIQDLLDESECTVQLAQQLKGTDKMKVEIKIDESTRESHLRTFDVRVPSILIEDQDLQDRFLERLQNDDDISCNNFHFTPEADYQETDNVDITIEW